MEYNGIERRRASPDTIYRGLERRQQGNVANAGQVADAGTQTADDKVEAARIKARQGYVTNASSERKAEASGFTCPNCGFNSDVHKDLVEKSGQAVDARTQAADEVEAARIKAIEDKRVLDIEHAQATTDIETERAAAAEKLRLADAEVARVREETARAMAASKTVQISSGYTGAERRSGHPFAGYAGQERRKVVGQHFGYGSEVRAYAGMERRGGPATVFPAYAGSNRRAQV